MVSLNKIIYRGLLILSFVGVNLLILFGLSQILAYLSTGADRSNMLHLDVKRTEVYLPELNWESLENPGRPMEMQTLGDLQKDYLDAWYVRNVAYQTNQPYGIEDYYTDSARVNLFSLIEWNKSQDIHIESTTLNHSPFLDFYSADGQLVSFTDKQVVQYQKIYKNNELIATVQDTSDYQVVMLLEDGFWRIRHQVKLTPSLPIEKTKRSNQYQVKNGELLVNGETFSIAGINYYPQDTPWDMFAEKFDSTIINNDFKFIRQSVFNSIRIFIPYHDFGKAEVKEDKLKKLQIVLDLASQNQLKVVATLFDFYGDYSVMDWSLTNQHAKIVVSRFKDHPAILAWDLKNEPDLDFESRGKENVLEWLRQMASEVQQYDSNHLITIGWASPQAATNLKNVVDLVSFHYYQEIDQFQEKVAALRQAVPSKPLVLQEYGLSTYRGIWNPFGNSLKDQEAYYKKMQAFLEEEKLAFMLWTLYDFKHVPSSVVGRLPWRKSNQKHFGILDRLGNPKPAFRFFNR